jgi:hypothetical protein
MGIDLSTTPADPPPGGHEFFGVTLERVEELTIVERDEDLMVYLDGKLIASYRRLFDADRAGLKTLRVAGEMWNQLVHQVKGHMRADARAHEEISDYQRQYNDWLRGG